MYEVYRKKDDGSEVIIPCAIKAHAILVAGRINVISNGGWKVRRIKTDYIYVVNRDGKYLTTVKTRKRARHMVKWYNKLGIKCTITQIDLNKAGGKTVR